MKTFKIKQFEWAGKRYILKEPVEAQRERMENGLWVFKIPEYQTHVFAYLIQNAEKDLNEDFAILYEDLCLEKNENLSPIAIELKNRVLANLERIEDCNEAKTTHNID